MVSLTLPSLISDLAILLLTGGVVTVIFKKLGQPLVLGYILAGFLIGPYLPYFFTVEDMTSIGTWSEIGIIVLMFGLGLEFNLHKLLRVGGTAIITALTVMGGMMLLGFAAGSLLGWNTMDCVFLGGMLSMSSTTIIIKAFDELGVPQDGFAQRVFGTLVIEDIAGIFMMIILSTISVSQNISGGELALELGLMLLYLVLWLIAGIFLLPTLLNRASGLMSDETLLIVSLGICFGMVLLADALGFSSALGAFLAGSLMAGTVHAERVQKLTSGVKDLFGTVFFISVGMMLDPAVVRDYILPILLITAVTITGQFLFASLGMLLSGQDLNSAVHCGCSMAQIGEFAFIIASMGLNLGVIADYVYPIIIAVSVITTLTTPFMIRSADKIYALAVHLLPDKLTEKLRRYTSPQQSDREKDNDWIAYLKRCLKITVLYGVIMSGISLLGCMVLFPLLEQTGMDFPLCGALSVAAVFLGIAPFIRPMLDIHSPHFTVLWMKKQSFRPPLIALSALRGLIVVLIAFIAVRRITGISSLWFLFLAAAFIFLASRFGGFATIYLSAEARFLANLNERRLHRLSSDETQQWLDERLLVCAFRCPHADGGKTLQRLGWGRTYGVNVIRLSRGKRRINMPSGNTVVSHGDTVWVIGETDNLRSMAVAGYFDTDSPMPTLREFIASQPDNTSGTLYTYALAVDKGSPLAGCSIKDSNLRDRYDCMILGLQRNRLPIVSPDVNMAIQSGDIVWLLGTGVMAGHILTDAEDEQGE